MSVRKEIEEALGEMTQAELAQLLLRGASTLRRLQGGEDKPFFFVKIEGELLAYWSGPMAEVMQAGIKRLIEKYGGQQVQIDTAQ